MFIIKRFLLKGFLLLTYPVIADLRKRQFYVWPVIAMSILMAVIQLFNKDTKFIDILTGCIPGVVVWLFSRWSEGAIGEGDAFVIGGLGMVIGWRMVCSVCFTACLLCASVAVYLLLGRKGGKRMELPFMPFLAVAYLMNYW